MAILTGFSVDHAAGGIDNPNLSTGFNDYAGAWFPYSASAISLLKDTTLTRAFPIQANSRVIDGFKVNSYNDDFYYRIHITPAYLDLGNMATDQELDLYVWNAHFTSKQLTAITGVSTDLALEGIQPAYRFKALEEQHYKLSISIDGAPVIDDHITWQFDNETPNIHITGNRVVGFSFMPNWGDDGILERLEWSTDILTSESGMEQRRALYSAPRRFFTADFLPHARERQYLNNILSAWGARAVMIPLWMYAQHIQQPLAVGDTFIPCETQHLEFIAGGLALLWVNTLTYELVEINDVASNGLTLKKPLLKAWKKTTRIYPARSAYFLQQPELTRKTDQLDTTSIQFRLAEQSDYTAVAPSVTYKGYPVFELTPDESNDLTSQYQRLLLELDNGQALPLITDTSGRSFLIQAYRWLALGRVERVQLRQVLYYLNGCQKALWLPSHADDLTPNAIILATEPTINIVNCGYSRFAANDPDKRDIQIRLWDKRIFYTRIINSQIIDDDTEQLTLEAPLGVQIAPAQVAKISFIRLCRLNNESIEINHLTDSEGVASCNLSFRRVRDNEL